VKATDIHLTANLSLVTYEMWFVTELIRYGIVGCAGIGNTHATSVQAADGVEIVACADVNAETAATFANDHGVAATYTDIAEMIDDAELDAISVCTPSGTHADVVVEAAEAGAHVLCEKPLDVYADRMETMISACDKANVTLAGVFQKRFSPANQFAKDAIETGDLGQPVLGDTMVKWFRSQEYYDSGTWRGTREMDGGCLLNQAIHNIDLLQWLMGEVEEVQAVTDTLARTMECEDTAALVLRFENGAVGTIEATTAVKGGSDRTELNGTDGSLIIEQGTLTEFTVGAGTEEHYTAATESHDIDLPSFEWGDGHDAAVQDFVESLRDGSDPAVSGREARKAVDIILAAYKSSGTGESVPINDI
jgi:UDP-N-acetyl-2-amino-2-deoxyglucuronate dehydrogenase